MLYISPLSNLIVPVKNAGAVRQEDSAAEKIRFSPRIDIVDIE